jgi:hypothetical protein
MENKLPLIRSLPKDAKKCSIELRDFPVSSMKRKAQKPGKLAYDPPQHNALLFRYRLLLDDVEHYSTPNYQSSGASAINFESQSYPATHSAPLEEVGHLFLED